MNKTIDLRTPDLRKVPIGTTVITSKGFKFKLVSRKNGKEAWKDLKSKLTWFDKEDKEYTFDEAIQKFGDSLPTKEEFEEGENHGFREVLPNSKDQYFWSASVFSSYREYAWYFYESYGNVGNSSRNYGYGVRCVGR